MSKALTEQKNSKLISTKISVRDMTQIERLIRNGIYMSRSDFTRSAVRELIKKHDNKKSGV